MLDSNVSTYIDKDGNVQEVGSGGTVDADALIALLSGGNGIAIAKNAAGDKVEAKLAIPETGPISLTNNNTPTPAISIDVTSPYGPPTSSGLVVNNGTNYVKVGGREIGVGNESSSKEIRITDTDVVCMNSATGDYDYFLRQGNVKTINGQSIYGSGDIKSYPIGSIYISASSATPGSLFGGTWEQIKDVFLLSAGNTYPAGLTGGSADAVVVEHKHTFATLVASDLGGAYSSPATANNYSEIRQSADTNTTGVDGTGKNMPPYLTVYMWRRLT